MTDTPLVPRSVIGKIEKAVSAALETNRAACVIIVDENGQLHCGFDMAANAPQSDLTSLHCGIHHLNEMFINTLALQSVEPEGSA